MGELKYARGQRGLKNVHTFYLRNLQHSKFIHFVYLCQNYTDSKHGTQCKIRNIKFRNYPFWFTFSLVISQLRFAARAENKCSRIITHVHRHCVSHWSLWLSPVAIAVVVFLKSLFLIIQQLIKKGHYYNSLFVPLFGTNFVSQV